MGGATGRVLNGLLLNLRGIEPLQPDLPSLLELIL